MNRRQTRQAQKVWASLTQTQRAALIAGESATAATANALASAGLVRNVTRYEDIGLNRSTGWQETALGRRVRMFADGWFCQSGCHFIARDGDVCGCGPTTEGDDQ